MITSVFEVEVLHFYMDIRSAIFDHYGRISAYEIHAAYVSSFPFKTGDPFNFARNDTRRMTVGLICGISN